MLTTAFVDKGHSYDYADRRGQHQRGGSGADGNGLLRISGRGARQSACPQSRVEEQHESHVSNECPLFSPTLQLGREKRQLRSWGSTGAARGTCASNSLATHGSVPGGLRGQMAAALARTPPTWTRSTNVIAQDSISRGAAVNSRGTPFYALFLARPGRACSSTSGCSYFEVFHRALEKYRGTSPRVLEIGVYRGGGLACAQLLRTGCRRRRHRRRSGAVSTMAMAHPS
jgi:hypothetical protein